MSESSHSDAEQQPMALGPDSQGLTGSRRRMVSAAVLVLLMGLVAGIPSLLARDLWYADEVRLTEGARELLQSREGSLPRINGEVDLTAAPLPYWATAALWKAGAGTASARVLSVLCVLGMTALCFAAMAGSGNFRAGTLASAIALTTLALLWQVRKGGPDPLWALLLTCALLAGYRALSGNPRRSGAWWVACYAGAALAMLAVGVSAVLLVALVLGTYCLAARRQPVRAVAPHALGLVAFVGIVTLELHAVGANEPALRPLTGDLAGLVGSLREGGLPKAALATAAALLPWIVIVPTALAAAFRGRRDGRAGLPLFAAIWLGVLAVPAVLGGRAGAPSYSLGMVPPLAILCAGALVPGGSSAGASASTKRWLVRGALTVVGLSSGLVLLAGLFDLAGGSYLFVGKSYVCPVTDQPYSPYALASIVPFLVASFAAVVAAFRTPPDRPDRQAWLLVLAVFLLGIPGDLFLTPFLNAYLSAKPFAAKVGQHVRPQDALYLYRKDYDGLFNLYTGRAHIPVLKDQNQLLDCLSRPGVFVLADRDRVEKLRPPVKLSDLLVAWGRAGHSYMVLLRGEPGPGNAPPPSGGPPGSAGSVPDR